MKPNLLLSGAVLFLLGLIFIPLNAYASNPIVTITHNPAGVINGAQTVSFSATASHTPENITSLIIYVDEDPNISGFEYQYQCVSPGPGGQPPSFIVSCPTPYRGPYPYNQTIEYYAVAQSADGGWTMDGTYSFQVVDNIKPTVSIYHAPTTPSPGSMVTFVANASDLGGSGLSSITIYIDENNDGDYADSGEQTTCASSPCSVTRSYGAGQAIKYYAIAKDGAGNSGNTSIPAGNFTVSGAQLSLTPADFDFGTVAVGGTFDKNFTLQNNSAGGLGGTLTVPAPFSCVSGCSYYFALGGGTQTVTIRFSPTATGLITKTITASHALSGGNVQGTGIATQLSLAPADFNFGNVAVGETRDQTFTLKNNNVGGTAGGALTVPAPFSCVSGCSYNLVGGGTQNVTIRFSPTVAGSITKTVTAGQTLSGGNIGGIGISGPSVGDISPTVATVNTDTTFSVLVTGFPSDAWCIFYADSAVQTNMTMPSSCANCTATYNYKFTTSGNHTAQAWCGDNANDKYGIVTPINVTGGGVVCDNDGTCDSGETNASCPADCPAGSTCNNNGTCDSGETGTSCPADCGSTPSSCGCGSSGGGIIKFCNPLKFCSFEDLVNNIIGFIFTIGVILAPLMYLIAGFYIVTAAGDVQKVTTGKSIILYTTIGLGILLFARGLIAVIKSVIGG